MHLTPALSRSPTSPPGLSLGELESAVKTRRCAGMAFGFRGGFTPIRLWQPTSVKRYDPRDITELRVFHRDRFLCRAVSAHHVHQAISLKDIQQAPMARRNRGGSRSTFPSLRRRQIQTSHSQQSRKGPPKS